MSHRTSLWFWVLVSVLIAELISACEARPAGPAAPPVPEADRARATEALALSAPEAEGTPPGFPTVVVDEVVNHPQVVTLLIGLEERGFTTELRDASRVELLQGAPGQAYRLGDGWLHLHVFADAASAEAAADNILAVMPHPLMDWVAPPHFFRCDRVIALYLGAGSEVISALGELCAPPFYTTDLRPAGPAATPEPLTSIDAALTRLLEMGEPIHATSAPEILRRVDLTSGVTLLYTYPAVQAGQPVQVTRVSYLDWRDPVWYPDGDLMDAVSDPAALPAVQLLTRTFIVNGGADTPELPDRVTFAGGRVSDPAVVNIRVSYSDGSVEVVPVENGAYLAARLDVERVEAIEALGASGQVLVALAP